MMIQSAHLAVHVAGIALLIAFVVMEALCFSPLGWMLRKSWERRKKRARRKQAREQDGK
jgi:hypothetical protein